MRLSNIKEVYAEIGEHCILLSRCKNQIAV
jgi:hypothetical protein